MEDQHQNHGWGTLKTRPKCVCIVHFSSEFSATCCCQMTNYGVSVSFPTSHSFNQQIIAKLYCMLNTGPHVQRTAEDKIEKDRHPHGAHILAGLQRDCKRLWSRDCMPHLAPTPHYSYPNRCWKNILETCWLMNNWPWRTRFQFPIWKVCPAVYFQFPVWIYINSDVALLCQTPDLRSVMAKAWYQ